jgi:hypothetical protein
MEWKERKKEKKIKIGEKIEEEKEEPNYISFFIFYIKLFFRFVATE